MMEQVAEEACGGARRRLTILNVSYPLAPVTADPPGGAEQVLAHLDRALVAAGHRSIVLAPAGSRVAGELHPIGRQEGLLDEAARVRAQAELRDRLPGIIERERPDVVHLHGLDFAAYLPPPGPPVLVTLHLPLDWYAPEALRPGRPDTWLHPVSPSQASTAPQGARIAAPIENGVDLDAPKMRKRRFALTIGRICPEKGMDDAIAAAKAAGSPLLLAGTVFPYAEHQRYFASAILPRLDKARRWIGAVAGMRKKRLLAQARCVLVPSKVRETSSLVAMEAIAAGTPVVAYPAGALPDIVEHGRTGFIVRDVGEMAKALSRAEEIDPEECRQRARERFSAGRMIAAYFARYAELAR